MRAAIPPVLVLAVVAAACSEPAAPAAPVAPQSVAVIEPEWVAREEAAKRANPPPAIKDRASDDARFTGKTY